jgi:hypothetical protein
MMYPPIVMPMVGIMFGFPLKLVLVGSRAVRTNHCGGRRGFGCRFGGCSGGCYRAEDADDDYEAEYSYGEDARDFV